MEDELSRKCVEYEKKLKLRYFSQQIDFIRALEYLEVFCLYAAQRSAVTPMYEPKNKPVMKVIEIAENTIDLLLRSKKSKSSLKPNIKLLIHNVHKIRIENLNALEQNHFSKNLEKAEKILKKLYK